MRIVVNGNSGGGKSTLARRWQRMQLSNSPASPLRATPGTARASHGDARHRPVFVRPQGSPVILFLISP